MLLNKSIVPNTITSLRILGTAILLFIQPFSTEFYIIYTLCGFTDAIDGTVARALHCKTTLGAKLDSVADLLLYAAMLLKILPTLRVVLPSYIWYIVGAVFAIRIASYLIAAIKYHHFASLHTYLNKLTGFAVFAAPYIIKLSYAIPICLVIAIIGGVASIEEFFMHITSKQYTPNRKTIFQNAD